MDLMLEGAAKLHRINPDVLIDIDDFIMLQAFNSEKLNPAQVNQKVALYLETMRDREKMHILNAKEERDVHEEGKVIDAKRKILNANRPDKKIWNYVEEGDHIPHVLRVDADPRKAYEDGRIQEILLIIEKLAEHLKAEQGWLAAWTWQMQDPLLQDS